MFAVRCHSSVDQALFPCTLFVCPLSDPVSRPRCSSGSHVTAQACPCIQVMHTVPEDDSCSVTGRSQKAFRIFFFLFVFFFLFSEKQWVLTDLRKNKRIHLKKSLSHILILKCITGMN